MPLEWEWGIGEVRAGIYEEVTFKLRSGQEGTSHAKI